MNKDIVKRDALIFGGYESGKYQGGIRRFKNLSLEALNRLINEDFADKNDAQNYSPTISEIADFMTKYSGYTAHGYTVDISRNDYRVTLEGVKKDRAADSLKELQEFNALFGDADELTAENQMYCWFD